MDAKKIVILAVCLVALVISVIRGVHSNRPAKSLGEPMMEGLSDAAVQLITQLSGGSADVVLIAPDCDQCVLANRLRPILEKALKGGKGITLQATEQVPVDNRSQMGLAAGDYARIVEQHPSAKVVVSIAGLPPATAKDWPKGDVKLLAIATGGNGEALAQSLLSEGRIAAAIVPRLNANPGATVDPKSPRSLFEANYSVHTK